MIIIINGAAGTGKDTFVEFCEKNKTKTTWITQTSMISFVKNIFEPYIDIKEKNEEYRKALYEIKQAVDKYDNLSFKTVIKYYNSVINFFKKHANYDVVMFIYARETKDIKQLIEYFTDIGETVKTLYVINPNITPVISNEADRQAVEDKEIDYDYLIVNDGSLEELEEKAKIFMEMINKEIK